MLDTERFWRKHHHPSIKIMRLFLTSGGITNKTLEFEFCSLLSKPLRNSSVAFIPTAANVYSDTSWLERDIDLLKQTGIGSVQMVDISRLAPEAILAECSKADILWINGGNTYYLMDWVRRSGLAERLLELLTTRLYVGVSAGSMITGPTIETNTPMFPEEDDYKINNLTGLRLVPFAIVPHLNSTSFPSCSAKNLERFAANVSYPIYALDDASAISVNGKSVRTISEGQVLDFNFER